MPDYRRFRLAAQGLAVFCSLLSRFVIRGTSKTKTRRAPASSGQGASDKKASQLARGNLGKPAAK